MALIGQAPKEIIQFALQAPEHAACQDGNQHGERQGTAASEISGADAMRCNKRVGRQCSLDLGE
jgi:hypothetical protein